jgi:hypothetical protein
MSAFAENVNGGVVKGIGPVLALHEVKEMTLP